MQDDPATSHTRLEHSHAREEIRERLARDAQGQLSAGLDLWRDRRNDHDLCDRRRGRRCRHAWNGRAGARPGQPRRRRICDGRGQLQRHQGGVGRLPAIARHRAQTHRAGTGRRAGGDPADLRPEGLLRRRAGADRRGHHVRRRALGEDHGGRGIRPVAGGEVAHAGRAQHVRRVRGVRIGAAGQLSCRRTALAGAWSRPAWCSSASAQRRADGRWRAGRGQGWRRC